jgi:hypothetical protein
VEHLVLLVAFSEEFLLAGGTAAPAPGCRGVVLAAGAGFEVADAAGGAGVDATALGQELA